MANRRSTTAGTAGKMAQEPRASCQYSSLDDDSYWKIQPWVEHQRPSRWIIDLAMQKTVALRAQCTRTHEMAMRSIRIHWNFMIFLATSWDPNTSNVSSPWQNPRTSVLDAQPPDAAARPPADAATGTREMRNFSRQTRAAARWNRTGRAHGTQGSRAAKQPQSPRLNSRRGPSSGRQTRRQERFPASWSATDPRMSRARKSSPMQPAGCNGDGNGTSCRSSSRAWRTADVAEVRRILKRK